MLTKGEVFVHLGAVFVETATAIRIRSYRYGYSRYLFDHIIPMVMVIAVRKWNVIGTLTLAYWYTLTFEFSELT